MMAEEGVGERKEARAMMGATAKDYFMQVKNL